MHFIEHGVREFFFKSFALFRHQVQLLVHRALLWLFGSALIRYLLRVDVYFRLEGKFFHLSDFLRQGFYFLFFF